MEVKFHYYYARRVKSDGKLGALVEFSAPYSPLYECDLCHDIGPRKRIYYRSDVHGWNREDRLDSSIGPSKDTLCTGCWNKARAVVSRVDSVIENKAIINKINRIIKNERKQRKQVS